MIIKTNLKSCISAALVVLLIALLAGCAARRPFWGDVKKGLILEYRMPQDHALKYQFSSNMTQNLEVMGQSMKNIINLDLLFSAKSTGMEGNNHRLLITIDSAKTDVKTPQGNISPDMSSVFGKSFHMTLSPLGKELKMSGADSITYSMGQGGERTLTSNFQTIFPDLAGKPVMVGDSWTTTDTVNVNEGSMEMRMTFVSVNTLQGFETVDGHECVTVTAKSTGKLGGEGEQMGANLYFEGDIETKDVWYFAYKEGIFVKSISEGMTEGNVAVTGAQKMTIPMTMEMKVETKLVK
jgi:hypothetical protein